MKCTVIHDTKPSIKTLLLYSSPKFIWSTVCSWNKSLLRSISDSVIWASEEEILGGSLAPVSFLFLHVFEPPEILSVREKVQTATGGNWV